MTQCEINFIDSLTQMLAAAMTSPSEDYYDYTYEYTQ